MRITEQTDLRFPLACDEERENLERELKQSRPWEQVLGLEPKRLKRRCVGGTLDDATIRALLGFAEEKKKVSLRLLRKREEEE